MWKVRTKSVQKCAMEVYLPTLEDLSQNESETAVYGCHWPRDSTLRMGRSAQFTGSGGLLSGGSRGPGARFSKVPVTFWARNQIFKSKYKE